MRQAVPSQARHVWDAARLALVTGVAVLTTGAGGQPHGTTVSTISLASRRPPLISVALRDTSAGLAILKRSRVFAVNTLAADQATLARYFADPRRARGFVQLPAELWYCRVADGIPLLRGAIAWWECRVEQEIPVGDHELVVARIVSVTPGIGAPLVNFAGTLGGEILLRRP